MHLGLMPRGTTDGQEAFFSRARSSSTLVKRVCFCRSGKRSGEVCRRMSVSEQSSYRWRKEYGGLKIEQTRRLKELEQENAWLKRTVAERALDKLILKVETGPWPKAAEARRRRRETGKIRVPPAMCAACA